MNTISLDALCDPRIETLMHQQKSKLQEWVNGLGSPLHLLFPDIFQQSIEKFKQVLNKHKINYQLLFAKKANKTHCFAQVYAEQEVGIDVASISELYSSPIDSSQNIHRVHLLLIVSFFE